MGTASNIAPQSTLGPVRAVALLFAVAPFVAHVSPVRPHDIQFSYRSGCPVTHAELRVVRLSFWGFDGKRHLGSLVVNRKVTGDMVAVFRRLYAVRFPLRRVQPVSAFHGSDDASMAADNTSGFNCRRAVGSATGGWSAHAYGLAIDVNPIENPYMLGTRVLPPAGTRYLDRAHRRPGMAVAGGVLVQAFESVGWKWGGRWSRSPDYQHFSATGR
jgi:hypothetical protein